ncbi:hypothetical protein EC973_006754 [Apophysomyces ossiformis]|uniref:Arsenate reductase n=1 Tax=Apophysomyces ossiformis TaxID=679940 RepID=A0A8H7BV03_9FUNG|nr:hypothetical protein EC973_006754 [Apophysomyces ossiformis]
MSFRPPKTLPILSIFHNAQCSKSRAALQLLLDKQKRPNEDDAYKVDVVDYQQTPPTSDQLRQVAQYLEGNSVPAWRRMIRSEAQDKVHNWQEAQKLLLEQPALLERPIVVDWEKGLAALGRPTLEAVEKLIQGRLKECKM